MIQKWKSLSARAKFALSLAAMAAVYVGAIVTDTSTDAIDIPYVPDLSLGGRELPVVSPAGDPLGYTQVQKELRALFPHLSRGSISLADRHFQPVTHTSMNALIRWMDWFYWATPQLRFNPESYDCDNFARTFVVIGDLSGAHRFTGQIAVFRIYTRQHHAWAGVPSGGYHALILYRTEKGWYVYEPQGRHIIAARRYPNRTYISRIKGD